MSLIDGGVFKCGNHDEEFITDNKQDWDQHLAEHKDLVKSGSGGCIVCGKPVTYKDIPNHINPMHEECKEYLVGGNKE